MYCDIMSKLQSLKNMSIELKTELLKELGYDTDKEYVLENGRRYLDRYTEEPIKLDNMLILNDGLPKSVIILDNNSLSVTSFLEEFGDVL